MKTQENTYFVCILLGLFRKKHVHPFSYWHWRSPFQRNSTHFHKLPSWSISMLWCFFIKWTAKKNKRQKRRIHQHAKHKEKKNQNKTKQKLTRQDKTRQDKTRQDKTRQDRQKERKKERERERTNGPDSLTL